tara:strand:- start:4524 stop:4760 length:237 start_codon:yes stop_codon:yes gene_type:complete
MFITKKSSINRQLKDKQDDAELLADIIDRDDVERWTNNRFTDKQWNVVKGEIERRYDMEFIDWVRLVAKETIMNMGKS